MRVLKVVCSTLLMILLCHHLSGCASFEKNQLNIVDKLPSIPSKNNKQTLSYTFTSWVDDGHLEKEKNRERIYGDEFTNLLNDSGYFSILESGNDS